MSYCDMVLLCSNRPFFYHRYLPLHVDLSTQSTPGPLASSPCPLPLPSFPFPTSSLGPIAILLPYLSCICKSALADRVSDRERFPSPCQRGIHFLGRNTCLQLSERHLVFRPIVPIRRPFFILFFFYSCLRRDMVSMRTLKIVCACRLPQTDPESNARAIYLVWTVKCIVARLFHIVKVQASNLPAFSLTRLVLYTSCLAIRLSCPPQRYSSHCPSVRSCSNSQ